MDKTLYEVTLRKPSGDTHHIYVVCGNMGLAESLAEAHALKEWAGIGWDVVSVGKMSNNKPHNKKCLVLED